VIWKVLLVDAYLLTGLAMCLVLLLSLGGTAYLAVYFNRRAKADLADAYQPLADRVAGTFDLETAEITGTHLGYPIFARMANASEGPGRVFQTDVLDSAGGSGWRYTSNPPSKRIPGRTTEFSGSDEIRRTIEPVIDTAVKEFLNPEEERFRVEYLPEQGFIRLVRAMRSRRDIPAVGMLDSQLDMLTDIAARNRSLIEANREAEPDAYPQVTS
jgi:hypothetical protein